VYENMLCYGYLISVAITKHVECMNGHGNCISGHKEKDTEPEPSPSVPDRHQFETPVSDWQERMNQPLDDSAYFPADTDSFMLTNASTNNQDNPHHASFNSSPPFSDKANEDCYGQTNPKVDTYYSEGAVEVDKGNSRVGESHHHEYQTAAIKVKGEGASSVRFKLADDNEYDNEDDSGGDGNHGQIVQEELEFGTPTAIHPPQIPTLINNPLAGLNDSSNPPTPRHRRVSFDLDTSDKDEKSSSRSKRDECIGKI
jgi:hypothetical protein